MSVTTKRCRPSVLAELVSQHTATVDLDRLLADLRSETGDTARTAFSRVYQIVSPALFRVVRSRTSDDHTAHDVVQTAFTEFLLKHRNDEWTDFDQLVGRLGTIAFRRRVDAFRRQCRFGTGGEPIPDPPAERTTDPAAIAPASEDFRRAMEVIDALPMELREALIAHAIMGVTHDDIAESLGRPASTIRTWVHRARLRIRGALGDADVE